MQELHLLTNVLQSNLAFLAGCIAFPLLVGLYYRLQGRDLPRRLPLPPGPKGLPFIGNLLQIPQAAPWKVYHEWAQKYGSIFYLEVLGNPIVFLDTLEDSLGVLEKQSAVTSGRPSLPSLGLFDQNYNMGVMDYGPGWKAQRRTMHQSVNQNEIHKYLPIVEEEIHLFLRRLLEDPGDFMNLTRILFGHTIMRIAYGVKDFTYNEELAEEAEEQMEILGACFTQGRFLVDIIHPLRYLPSWLPGMGWKRWLVGGHANGQRMISRPFEDAKERRLIGDASAFRYRSIVQSLMDQLPTSADDPKFASQEHLAKCTAAVAYIGGSDTTQASGHALFMALALYPEVQRKAQAELDVVTENGSRLPTFDDLEHLPYIQAIVKEVTRWYSVAPLGSPHTSDVDIEYKGYFIPKGTMIRPNIWAIAHDPTVFEDPLEFKPERFIKDGKLDVSARDPDFIAFGRGRRICPGRHLSRQNLSFMTMSLLAVFTVRPSTKKGAKPLNITECSTDMISKLSSFEVEITPRSKRHAQLVL